MGRILIYKTKTGLYYANIMTKEDRTPLGAEHLSWLQSQRKMIAQDLVAEKLAACVSIVPGVQSFFAWVGKVDKANELLLVIKTTVQWLSSP